MGYFMRTKTIEKRIDGIKRGLAGIGAMRPGSLSKQYNVCGVARCRCKDPVSPKRHGPYHQLSYVHRGKSTTRFIRSGEVQETRAQLANYKRFKGLMEEWVRLALEHAETTLAERRKNVSK